MLYNGKVDVIIPAYNVSDEILFRALSSIVCQDRIEDIEVTIVDDASTIQNYQNIVNIFSSMIKINLLRYEINGGPGVARQYGLDHTQNEFIVFMDADDVFNGYFAISSLKGLLIENPQAPFAMGNFEETVVKNNKTLINPIEPNVVWLFGKIYRRSFLEIYNIRFHPTARTNEDGGFNSRIVLMSPNGVDDIVTTENIVYYWLYNPKSITREDDCSYSYRSDKTGSFYGYAQNKIYAIKESEKILGENNLKILDYIASTLVTFYAYYLESFIAGEKVAEENLIWCKWFYEECCQDIFNKISEQAFAKCYYDVMLAKYAGLGYRLGQIPKIDFFSFVNKLKEMDNKWEDMIK